MPFGGRDAELKQLNDWLLGNDSQRNLLITAPAGRGKTALLVHWIGQLNGPWPVAFVPISIRYETNRAAIFYQALAARLASILDETLPATPSDPANFYKEKVIEYLDKFEGSDRRCLIVIDGVDEATGWQIDTSVLPPEPPRGLKIVASARQLAGDYGARDWLRRLGWMPPRSQAATIAVPPLSREGISSVLEKMGFPLEHLARDVDIIGELFRLTEGGDPLLLELYVADLWKRGKDAARLTPRDLKGLEPGFGAYFRDWFEQQRRAWHDAGLVFDESKLDVVMALLSCALGPITLEAISQVIQCILGPDCLVTRETVAPMSRFVLGDGVETGFVLGHPKLAEFIQNDYFGRSQIVDRGRRAFVDWGRKIIQDLESGNMRPNQVPEYCLFYYVQHLEEQKDASALHYRELVEDGWRSAWLSHEEGLRGFARDIEVVWKRLLATAEQDHRLLRQPRTGLGGLIRCLLCLGSIRSVGAAVPTNFMVELVGQHLIGPGQALHFSRLKPEDERAAALQALASHLGPQIDEAISCAREIKAPNHQALTLAALAQHVAEPLRSGLVAEAMEAAGRCKEDYERNSVIERIRQYDAPKTGATDLDAMQRAPLVRTPPIVEAETGITDQPPFPEIVAQPTSEELRQELGSALSAPEWRRAYDLRILAPRLSVGLLTQALGAVLQWDSYDRREGLVALLPCLSSEQVALALGAALQWDRYDRRQGLVLLLPRLAPEQVAQALGAVLQWEDYDRREGLALLLPRLTPEQVTQALGDVLQWGSYYRREGLALLLPRLAHEQVPQTLATVLQSNNYDRGDLLAVLWPALAPGLRKQALDTLPLWESSARKHGLLALAPLLGLDLLRETVAHVSDNLEDLDVLLPYLPEGERSTVVAGAYKRGFQLGDQVALVAALTALTWRLSGSDSAEAISLACTTVHNISDRMERGFARLLLSCSPQLAMATCQQFLGEAIDCARGAPDPEERVFMESLISLSPAFTSAQANEILGSLVAESQKLDPEGAAAVNLIVLFSQKISDAQWEELLLGLSSRLERAPDKDFAAVLEVLASVIPRLPAPTARLFLEKGLQRVRNKRVEHPDDAEWLLFLALTSLSPHITDTEAQELAAEALSTTGKSAAFGHAVLLPHLSESLLPGSLLALLKTFVDSTRDELLGALSIVEGAWLDLIGVRPTLSRGQGSRSCLESVGGPGAISETLGSVLDVMRWWP